MSTIKIVPFCKEDIDDIVAMEEISYKNPWKKDFFLNELKNPDVSYMFVMKIDAEKNIITLGEKGMEFESELCATKLNFLAGSPPSSKFRCTAKNRYQAKPMPCTVKISNDIAIVTYDEPVRAITPGQAIVFYDDNILLGGGTVIQ